jgi:hypothetical protein
VSLGPCDSTSYANGFCFEDCVVCALTSSAHSESPAQAKFSFRPVLHVIQHTRTWDIFGTVRRRRHAYRVAGHSQTIVALHPADANATKHGPYSRTGRVLAPRAVELLEERVDEHGYDFEDSIFDDGDPEFRRSGRRGRRRRHARRRGRVRGWGGAKIGSAHPRGRARVRRNAGRENLVPDSVMGARLRP